jgi:signal peptidase II
LFWPIAFLGLAADLASKHYMFSQPDLLAGKVRWVWPNYVGFQLSLNEGALFGLGQGGVWLFAAFSIAAAIGIPAYLFFFGGARDLLLTIVLAAVTGGVLGNLYDRLGLPGLDWGVLRADRTGEPVYAVRDFVLVARHWPPRNRWDVWPNFNVADALLVGGAFSVAVLSWRCARCGEPPT